MVCALTGPHAQEKPASLQTGFAQSPPQIKPLTIGDTLPDVVFNQMMNYPAKTARLSDFENKKLLILDFWSTGCSACIGYFPHMQALANEFKNDLQIILVNSKTKSFHDNETKINTLLQRLRKQSDVDVQLPIVLNSKQLDDYFPWQTIPLEVWISGNGAVLAVTGATEVTASNIKAVIEGKKVYLHPKKDISFDLQNESLSKLEYSGNSSLPSPLYSVVIIQGLINGLGGRMGVRRNESGLYIGWYATNMPIINIYRSAYRNIIHFPDNRVLVVGKDSSRFKKINHRDTATYDNVYSFDITVPPTSFENLIKDVQHNLESSFNTKVSTEKREIKCYVLQSSPEVYKSYTKGSKQEYHLSNIDAKKYVHNYSMADLIHDLNYNYLSVPLIDDAHLKQHVDINFPRVLSESNILTALQRAGFKIKEEERLMDVVVIKTDDNL